MIYIRNYSKHQHYKNRKPPWIKLYRDIIDDQKFRGLSDFSARLLVDLWVLASEGEESGRIDLDADEILWRLRYNGKKASSITSSLKELEKQEFITLASTTLAGCYQDASAEERRVEGETEGKRETEKEEKPPFGFENFPVEYRDNKDFKKAWAAWVQYRIRKKAPLSDIAVSRQMKKLLTLSPPQASECILNTIEQGWSGLFPEKITGKPSNKPERGYEHGKTDFGF